MPTKCDSTIRRVLIIGLLCSFFCLEDLAAADELEMIRLRVRVHRLQSEKEPRLHCSLTDDEIREQFAAVNETWDQAKIVWPGVVSGDQIREATAR